MDVPPSSSAISTTVLPEVTLATFAAYTQPSEPCYNRTTAGYLRRSNGAHPSTGVVLAGAFGGIGGGLLLIALFCLYIRRRGRYTQLSDEEKQPFTEIHPFMSWRSPVPGTSPAKREGEACRQHSSGLPPVPAHKSPLPQSMQPVAASPERERRSRTRYCPRPPRERDDLGHLGSAEQPTEGARIPRKKKPAKVLSHGGRTVDWMPLDVYPFAVVKPYALAAVDLTRLVTSV
ncbi:hypothetical protein C8Q73DRAFT_693207 [Cubamyces lactineus]|nr:hypothetical protein C8Q73DRAFT_693207 [Cubamyces lactineus]